MKKLFIKSRSSLFSGIFLLSSLLCISCNGQTTNRTQENIVTISNDEATTIFQSLVNIEPINCLATLIDNTECIVCMANKTGVEDEYNKMFYSDVDIVFYKLTKVNDKWKVETQKPLFSEELIYGTFSEDVEVTTIDNKPYLYFSYRTQQVTFQASVYFCLFSITNFELTTLEYSGEPIYDNEGDFSHVKGEFEPMDRFKSMPDQLSFLKDKAHHSSNIYEKPNQDFGFNSSENYREKWELDNPEVDNVWFTKDYSSNQQLKITYYDADLFDFENGSVSFEIENAYYHLKSFFRGNVIGYDKVKKKFFPIWVEKCQRGCDKEIKFIDDSKFKIIYSEAENQTVVVDLKQMTYKILK